MYLNIKEELIINAKVDYLTETYDVFKYYNILI